MTSLPTVAVLGASGRMGRAVVELIDSDYQEQCRLAATVSSRHGNFDELADADIVVDFSLPQGTAALAESLTSFSRPVTVVSGTTGLAPEELAALRRLADSRTVLHANNFSAGVAALTAVLEFAAPMLESLGYSAAITETHHSGKRDAPSGTAKVLQAALRPDAPESIQTHSVRAGAVIGEHDVRFFGPDDEVQIRHTAMRRSLFARGALDAALWLHAERREPGFLTMKDYFAARFLSAE